LSCGGPDHIGPIGLGFGIEPAPWGPAMFLIAAKFLSPKAVSCGLGGAVGYCLATGPFFPLWADSTMTIATWTGGGIFIGSILTALATGFFQPWLDRQSLKRALDSMGARVLVIEGERDRGQADNRRFVAQLADLTRQNADLTRQNADLTRQQILLSSSILAREGRFVPLTSSDVSVIVGDQIPTPLVDGEQNEAILARPQVLIVEDHPRARLPMKLMLEAAGYRVDSVDFCQDALEFLDRERPDFIILDLMLPDRDGIEILQRVRERHLPARVIVTTAKVEEQLGPVFELAPDALIHKPIDLVGKLLPTLRSFKISREDKPPC
jgi:CheY-like chemotaxis protein